MTLTYHHPHPDRVRVAVSDVRKSFQMIGALLFVSPGDVDMAWRQLKPLLPPDMAAFTWEQKPRHLHQPDNLEISLCTQTGTLHHWAEDCQQPYPDTSTSVGCLRLSPTESYIDIWQPSYSEISESCWKFDLNFVYNCVYINIYFLGTFHILRNKKSAIIPICTNYLVYIKFTVVNKLTLNHCSV